MKGESAIWREVVETRHRVLVDYGSDEILAMIQSRGNNLVWTVYDEEGNALASGFSPHLPTAEKECVATLKSLRGLPSLRVRRY